MIASIDRLLMPPETFLDWEEQQSWKHEYLNGEAYTMTGGTLAHNDIAINLTTLLKPHLRGKGCKVRMADAKVQITEQGPFFYPDVVVTCDERDRNANRVIRYPCLVIEVLSPSTEGYDRGQKFKQYRRLETLKEYVLVNVETMGVECFRLNAQHKWELAADFANESADDADAIAIEFASISFQCSLAAIYDEVNLNAAIEPDDFDRPR
jgi:Uma2 family endonuclease